VVRVLPELPVLPVMPQARGVGRPAFGDDERFVQGIGEQLDLWELAGAIEPPQQQMQPEANPAVALHQAVNAERRRHLQLQGHMPVELSSVRPQPPPPAQQPVDGRRREEGLPRRIRAGDPVRAGGPGSVLLDAQRSAKDRQRIQEANDVRERQLAVRQQMGKVRQRLEQKKKGQHGLLAAPRPLVKPNLIIPDRVPTAPNKPAPVSVTLGNQVRRPSVVPHNPASAIGAMPPARAHKPPQGAPQGPRRTASLPRLEASGRLAVQSPHAAPAPRRSLNLEAADLPGHAGVNGRRPGSLFHRLVPRGVPRPAPCPVLGFRPDADTSVAWGPPGVALAGARQTGGGERRQPQPPPPARP